jgi:hypothetical protein
MVIIVITGGLRDLLKDKILSVVFCNGAYIKRNNEEKYWVYPDSPTILRPYIS